MAEDKTTRKRRVIKKEPETVRQRAEKASKTDRKPRRIRTTAGKAARPLQAVHRLGRKEYYIPLPDNKLGRFLNKRRSIIPRYFREAWAELRQVTWPGRKETWQLTSAVFIFAIAFSVAVALVDYGLERIFRELILGNI